MKQLKLPILFSVLAIASIASTAVLGNMHTVYAGAAPVNPPDFFAKFVFDDGADLDVKIEAVSHIPTTPPGFIGYGTIIGQDGAGDPVLRVGTSHAFVCDSETQVPFGDGCEGVWHNHDAILRTPVNLTANINIDADPETEAISDCSDQGATFEVKALSFESPGSVSVTGPQISMLNMPKTSLSNTNVVPEPFAANFDFSQSPLVQKNIYPIVKFRIFVATADGSPALDANGVPLPIDGERRVCIFDVMAMDSMVGGDLLSIDSAALLLAGLQSSAIWMLPVLFGAAGVGAYYIKTRMNKE